ncbi:cordon-bleu protein-like 1 isoform X2 [Monodelphis domestica]|uniref:cordon-bleu protein-like 1 isoform X2 n=1 Tax=Monodelphis domestica TaxID=13616 RepID=UPI0024E2271E|nr:cordon-bleu protein-like 1 isoform X2 [Monodelphis domestica]
MGQACRVGRGAGATSSRTMDDRTRRAEEPPAAAPQPPLASSGRKIKGKAPLPPSESKGIDVSSYESVESSNFIMEQKENLIEKDIELSVVLPGDVIKSTTVHGSKPMMDLLIYLCAQYHLNPSSYTIDLLSAEKTPIKFKPNTPIGILEVEKVILKPKYLDKKKPTPVIPEQTVRVVINYKRTQKTVVRVSPHAPLQELIPIICSKCEFDPSHTILLKDYQSQEPLDLSKSFNDLGLRELYAMDASKAASVTDFGLSSSQDSCQVSPNVDIMNERENKKFFSFFQRSKKRREQTSSAPATPLMSKPRPTFTRSNTISKPYISNTLPSDVPKKRRAPLPPMPTSQSSPQDLGHTQKRPTSCMVKSISVDETNKDPSGEGILRSGSLPLSHTSSTNSSLRRTKRKAPSPPSKVSPDQSSETSNVTALKSVDATPKESIPETNLPEGSPDSDASLCFELPGHEPSTVLKLADEAPYSDRAETPELTITSLKPGISSEHSLEEIDEKEELNVLHKEESENVSSKSQENSFISMTVTKNEKEDTTSEPGIVTRECSESTKEEKQENRNTDGKELQSGTSSKEAEIENGRNYKIVDQNKNKDQSDMRFLPMNSDKEVKNGVRTVEISLTDVTENNKLETDRPSDSQTYKNDIVPDKNEPLQTFLPIQDQKMNQSNLEKVKTQDAAIQTTQSHNNLDNNRLSETVAQPDHNLSTFRGDENIQFSNNNKSSPKSFKPELSVDLSRELKSQRPLNGQEDILNHKDENPVLGNDGLFVPVDVTNKTLTDSCIKSYPLYKPDYKTKPKPSNEITRDYIPKIGMTTYKIVPPKSLDISKDWESETTRYNKGDQEIHSPENRQSCEQLKESAIQTDALISESSRETQTDMNYEPKLGMEHHIRNEMSVTDGTISSTKTTSKLNKDNGTTPLMMHLEHLNSIIEPKGRPKVLSSQTKPSSFFLQMQKRASGHYVTSAAAKSINSTSSSAQNELKHKEVEKKLSSPQEETLSPLNKSITFLSELHDKQTNYDINQRHKEIPISPTRPLKPVNLPSTEQAALTLKTLRTFGAPRPYTSSSPSPFALAVVKRSQSFSKTHTAPSQSSREEDPSPGPLSSVPKEEEEKNSSLDKLLGVLQSGKEAGFAHNEQKCQIQSSTDRPSFTLKRQTSLTFQSADPEQIRQSLLTAIRSGEAAAKLKRVTVPSNTISVNGRPRLSYPVSPETQSDH